MNTLSRFKSLSSRKFSPAQRSCLFSWGFNLERPSRLWLMGSQKFYPAKKLWSSLPLISPIFFPNKKPMRQTPTRLNSSSHSKQILSSESSTEGKTSCAEGGRLFQPCSIPKAKVSRGPRFSVMPTHPMQEALNQKLWDMPPLSSISRELNQLLAFLQE